jgi:hypothetical protein
MLEFYKIYHTRWCSYYHNMQLKSKGEVLKNAKVCFETVGKIPSA